MTDPRTKLPAGPAAPSENQRLPVRALLALTTAAFITVLTEALPAGVLPAMSGSLRVSESAAGQLVTIYALGTAATAIPLSLATETWRRKRLLLAGVAGFAIANTVTTVSSFFPLTLLARFVAGVAAGVVWALLAGYARRLAPAGKQGKAIAVVMTGIPLALALGIPAGTFLGALLGWRMTFTVMTAIAVVLVFWILAAVPDLPGQRTEGRPPLRKTLRLPGVAPVLFVTLVFVLAHNILYTYIASFLGHIGMDDRVDVALLIFGVASMAGIWVVGAHIDRRLRTLSVVSTIAVAVAVTGLGLVTADQILVYAATTLWGLGWGGVPTLLQTAVAVAGGEQADTAQAMLVTLWNFAMAGGGVVGGLLLDLVGPASFPWAVLALLLPALAVVIGARGFPADRRTRRP